MALPTVYQLPLFTFDKRCQACGDIKALDAFRVAPTALDGRRNKCYSCVNAEARTYHAQHKAHQNANCRAWKAAHREDVRAYATHYDREHRELKRQRDHQRRANDSYREKMRLEYWANPDSARARARRWYWAEPDRGREIARQYRLRHPDRVLARARRWYHTHPDYARQMRMLRRARYHAAPGKFTQADVQALEMLQQGLCAYCQHPYGRYHVDHKQPLARGGSNWPDNLCLSCSHCNFRKGAKTDAEFRAWLNVH